MNCPKCKSKKVTVKDAVDVSWNEVYRAKKCQDCGHLFFTCEFEVEPTARFKKEWNLYKSSYGVYRSKK